MAKGKRKKSKRTTPNKARHPRPCVKGKKVLIMCAISILLLGGTAFYIYRQLTTGKNVRIDLFLVIVELFVWAVTMRLIFLWWRSR